MLLCDGWPNLLMVAVGVQSGISTACCALLRGHEPGGQPVRSPCMSRNQVMSTYLYEQANTTVLRLLKQYYPDLTIFLKQSHSVNDAAWQHRQVDSAVRKQRESGAVFPSVAFFVQKVANVSRQ